MVVAIQDKDEWQSMANCMGVDPDLFFPERGASTREAKEVCRGCLVRQDCLEYALANGEKFGIWGGLSERERRQLRRQRQMQRGGRVVAEISNEMPPPRERRKPVISTRSERQTLSSRIRLVLAAEPDATLTVAKGSALTELSNRLDILPGKRQSLRTLIGHMKTRGEVDYVIVDSCIQGIKLLAAESTSIIPTTNEVAVRAPKPSAVMLARLIALLESRGGAVVDADGNLTGKLADELSLSSSEERHQLTELLNRTCHDRRIYRQTRGRKGTVAIWLPGIEPPPTIAEPVAKKPRPVDYTDSEIEAKLIAYLSQREGGDIIDSSGMIIDLLLDELDLCPSVDAKRLQRVIAVMVRTGRASKYTSRGKLIMLRLSSLLVA
jgi:WhiB family redox-sensing transcriptional regulator